MSKKFYKETDVQILLTALACNTNSHPIDSESLLEVFAKIEPVSVPEFDENTIKGRKRIVEHVEDENERIRKVMEGK